MDAESEQVEDLKRLITELCDALEEHVDFEFENEVKPLIQRAREAAR